MKTDKKIGYMVSIHQSRGSSDRLNEKIVDIQYKDVNNEVYALYTWTKIYLNLIYTSSTVSVLHILIYCYDLVLRCIKVVLSYLDQFIFCDNSKSTQFQATDIFLSRVLINFLLMHIKISQVHEMISSDVRNSAIIVLTSIISF